MKKQEQPSTFARLQRLLAGPPQAKYDSSSLLNRLQVQVARVQVASGKKFAA